MDSTSLPGLVITLGSASCASGGGREQRAHVSLWSWTEPEFAPSRPERRKRHQTGGPTGSLQETAAAFRRGTRGPSVTREQLPVVAVIWTGPMLHRAHGLAGAKGS